MFSTSMEAPIPQQTMDCASQGRRDPSYACFHCEKPFSTGSRKTLRQFRISLDSMFTTDEHCLAFFEVDSGKHINLSRTFICVLCYGLLKKRTLPNWRGLAKTRKFKQTRSGHFVTISSELLDQQPGASVAVPVKQQQQICRQDEELATKSEPLQNYHVYPNHFYEHNYTECHPDVQAVPVNSPPRKKVLMRRPALNIKKLFCFNCGNELKKLRGKSYMLVPQIFDDIEQCKEIFQWVSEPTNEQMQEFPEAKICFSCLEIVVRRMTRLRSTDDNDVPSKKTKRPLSWKQKAFNLLDHSCYKALFTFLLRNCSAAKRAFFDCCCKLIRDEKKKFYKVSSVFTRDMTEDSLTWFSLEETGQAAKTISPFIGNILQALLPSSGQKALVQRQKSAEEREKFLATRLGFILGVILYTNSPNKFKFIQSCLGMKLWQEETSMCSLNWLNQAGVVMGKGTIRKQARAMSKNAKAGTVEKVPSNAGDQNKKELKVSAIKMSEESLENEPSDVNLPEPVSAASDAPNNPSEEGNNSNCKSEAYKCCMCPKSFRLKQSLKKHRFVHSEARPYKCKWCGRHYKFLGFLLNHLCQPKDVNMSSMSMPSKIQQEASSNSSTIHDREGEANPEPSQPSVTEESGEGLNSETLQRIKTRSQSKLFKTKTTPSEESCSTSEMPGNTEMGTFTTLFKPYDYHASKRRYPCEKCSKTFLTRPLLRKHYVSVHASDRKYTCSVCEKTFACGLACRRHEHICHGLHNPEEIKREQKLTRKNSNMEMIQESAAKPDFTASKSNKDNPKKARKCSQPPSNQQAGNESGDTDGNLGNETGVHEIRSATKTYKKRKKPSKGSSNQLGEEGVVGIPDDTVCELEDFMSKESKFSNKKQHKLSNMSKRSSNQLVKSKSSTISFELLEVHEDQTDEIIKSSSPKKRRKKSSNRSPRQRLASPVRGRPPDSDWQLTEQTIGQSLINQPTESVSADLVLDCSKTVGEDNTGCSGTVYSQLTRAGSVDVDYVPGALSDLGRIPRQMSLTCSPRGENWEGQDDMMTNRNLTASGILNGILNGPSQYVVDIPAGVTEEEDGMITVDGVILGWPELNNTGIS